MNLPSQAAPRAPALAARVVSLDDLKTDESRHLRLGWLLVALGFGGFLLWAFLAPLDKGVPVSGVVMVESNRQAVQHEVGGTVERILVREGERVEAGQVLVTMNDVQPRAAAEATRAQYQALRAIEARLLAESDGRAAIDYPQELLAHRDDARVAASMVLQSQLLLARQRSLRAELSAMQESMAGLRFQLGGLEESRDNKRAQLGFIKEQLDNVRELVRDGYVPRNRLLDLERLYAQLSGSIAEDMGQIGRIRSQIGELGLRSMQRQQEYQREVRTQLADVQKEAEALANRLKAEQHMLAQTQVRAPVAGTVVALNVFTNGGVVPAGFRLMDLVPGDQPLVLEAAVPVHLIDKVHPGLGVELIFSAFNQNVTPRVPGVLTHVGADRITDERSGAPYYKVLAQATPEARALIHNLELRPGMPVDLFIKTGERTLMNYLFKPLLDRASTALSEE